MGGWREGKVDGRDKRKTNSEIVILRKKIVTLEGVIMDREKRGNERKN